MNVNVRLWGLVVFWTIMIVAGCQEKRTEQTDFTRADSLTEKYLALQDTMLQAWNTMMYDDNRKIRAMHHLLHELRISDPEKAEEIASYKERLDALQDMRYDQESISNPEIVTEYDFASNALITELIALAESRPQFAYNTTLQKLVDSIRSADQRVMNYRAEYDEAAIKFNRFVEQHHAELEEMASDSFVVKKPLFQMAAD